MLHILHPKKKPSKCEESQATGWFHSIEANQNQCHKHPTNRLSKPIGTSFWYYTRKFRPEPLHLHRAKHERHPKYVAWPHLQHGRKWSYVKLKSWNLAHRHIGNVINHAAWHTILLQTVHLYSFVVTKVLSKNSSSPSFTSLFLSLQSYILQLSSCCTRGSGLPKPWWLWRSLTWELRWEEHNLSFQI